MIWDLLKCAIMWHVQCARVDLLSWKRTSRNEIVGRVWSGIVYVEMAQSIILFRYITTGPTIFHKVFSHLHIECGGIFQVPRNIVMDMNNVMRVKLLNILIGY